MGDWFECWLRGEASVVFEQSGPDDEETIQRHNPKAWYDNATEEELELLVEWVRETNPDVVLIGGNWYRKLDGRKMCDCCYENPTHTYSTQFDGSELCGRCSEL